MAARRTTASDSEGSGGSSGFGGAPETAEDRLWETPVGHDLAFLLARANALSLARLHDVLDGFGLKARSYSILSIAAADARPSQRELSEFLRLDPSQIVSLIDQLERKGLVRREPDPRDRRANVVVATTAGVEMAEEARRTVAESDRRWFSVLPSDDQERLSSVLRTLAAASAPQLADRG